MDWSFCDILHELGFDSSSVAVAETGEFIYTAEDRMNHRRIDYFFNPTELNALTDELRRLKIKECVDSVHRKLYSRG